MRPDPSERHDQVQRLRESRCYVERSHHSPRTISAYSPQAKFTSLFNANRSSVTTMGPMVSADFAEVSSGRHCPPQRFCPRRQDTQCAGWTSRSAVRPAAAGVQDFFGPLRRALQVDPGLGQPYPLGPSIGRLALGRLVEREIGPLSALLNHRVWTLTLRGVSAHGG